MRYFLLAFAACAIVAGCTVSQFNDVSGKSSPFTVQRSRLSQISFDDLMVAVRSFVQSDDEYGMLRVIAVVKKYDLHESALVPAVVAVHREDPSVPEASFDDLLDLVEVDDVNAYAALTYDLTPGEREWLLAHSERR